MLRGLRRFFGFDSAEEDELEPSLTTLTPGSSGPPSGAFRVGEKLSIKGEIVGEGDLELAGRFEGIVSVNGRVYACTWENGPRWTPTSARPTSSSGERSAAI